MLQSKKMLKLVCGDKVRYVPSLELKVGNLMCSIAGKDDLADLGIYNVDLAEHGLQIYSCSPDEYMVEEELTAMQRVSEKILESPETALKFLEENGLLDDLVKYPNLSKALKDGDCLHGFRSGGGLRVVHLNYASKTGGYGEHPHIETALEYAEDDLKVGGRKYKDFYGPMVDHYITGDSNPSSQLDEFILQGRDFDITFKDGKFVFSGGYYTRDLKKREFVLYADTLEELFDNFINPK